MSLLRSFQAIGPHEDIEDYLSGLEKYWTLYKVDEALWPEYLRPKMIGVWRERLASLTIPDWMDYAAVKSKLLAAVGLIPREAGVDFLKATGSRVAGRTTVKTQFPL